MVTREKQTLLHDCGQYEHIFRKENKQQEVGLRATTWIDAWDRKLVLDDEQPTVLGRLNVE